MSITNYLADIAPLRDQALYQCCYDALPLSRQQKTDRFRFEKDRLLSAGAGLLLQKAFFDAGFSVSAAEQAILYGPNDKPYLDEHFYSDRDRFFFNLSHSGDKVFCCVSDHPVGCDIEQIGPPNTEIARQFFAPSEYEQILHASHPDEMFYRLWVLKESYIKTTGQGLSTPLTSFCFDLTATASEISVSAELSCSASFTDTQWQGFPIRSWTEDDAGDPGLLFSLKSFAFREYSFIPGYRLARCAAL